MSTSFHNSKRVLICVAHDFANPDQECGQWWHDIHIVRGSMLTLEEEEEEIHYFFFFNTYFYIYRAGCCSEPVPCQMHHLARDLQR